MATIPDNKEWIESITAISKTDPVRFDVLNKTVEQINSRLGWLRENTEPSFSEVMIANDHDGHLAIESLPEGVFSVVVGDIEIHLSGGDSIAAGTEYHFCNAVESQVSFIGADIVSKGGTELVGDWHVCTLKKLEGGEWALFGDLTPNEPDEPALEGFVIKTTGGVVSVIEGPGEVSGTGVYAWEDGHIEGTSRLEEVLSWPDEKPTWLEGDGISFTNAIHLTKVPDSLPAWITTVYRMFEGCSSFNQDISGWDVSSVTETSNMFRNCSSFNQDISGWDVSSVEFMREMFQGCSSFNQDISGWDVSSVTDMYRMFSDCSNFNQDISGWDVSSATSMSYMFDGCSGFNQDLSGWCVSNFSSEPWGFSDNTPSWTLPKPIWGTCP